MFGVADTDDREEEQHTSLGITKTEMLRDTLSRTNDWTKFAEAKNGANVALCSAIIFGLTRQLQPLSALPDWGIAYICFCLALVAVSLLLSLTSFIPKLQNPWLNLGTPDAEDNYLFFGHACKYDPETYLNLLPPIPGEAPGHHNIHLMYAKQIVINAGIATMKFKQFEVAAWLLVAAIASPIGAGLIWMLRAKGVGKPKG